MVLHDNGHRHRRHSIPYHPIWTYIPALCIHRLLHSQYRSLCCSALHVHPPVHAVPRDLGRDDPGPDKLALPRDLSDGFRDTDRDVGVRLCAALGRVDEDGGVGVVDCRCGGGCVGDGVIVVHSVFPATDDLTKKADDNRISQTYITSLERITALQLLPIAATIVAAGTGAEVAEILPDPKHAMGTVLVSYILWGMGTPLAMTILVIYYQRLAVHKLPSRETIVSCFLPLGPLGFGGFG